MKNRFVILVAVVIVAVLLAYMFLFQVRYDQVAVLTTFKRADAPPAGWDGKTNAGSIKVEPGLYRRLPWPIQEVTVYPTRVQILDDPLEQMQTKDKFNVIIRTYLAWRIQDPHAFFVSLQNTDQAQKQLLQRLRAAQAIISQYNFDELVNNDPSKVKLADLEQRALEDIRTHLAQGTNFGIAVERVGIRRILLSEKVTEKVFARMKDTRNRLAQEARSSGDAQAGAIRSEAQSVQARILAFAESRATRIRAEGDQEAAQYYDKFKADQGFAVFLRQLDALKKMLANNTTFVLPADKISPLNLFVNEPGSATADQPHAEAGKP